jgi:hypothetical protein
MKLTPSHIKLLALVGAVAAVLAYVLFAPLGAVGVVGPGLLFAGAVVLLLLRNDRMAFEERLATDARQHVDHALVKLRRDLDAQEKTQYWQLEALVNIVATIQPRVPLPPTRKWAASPDMLRLVMHEVLSRRPQLVMEASSGTSTVIIAYCLQKLGGGKVVSLEHDPHYAQRTRDMLELHGLTAFAEVVDAPLVDHQIKGESRKWYDVSRLPVSNGIDMLVVDGPPKSIQLLARYPALPLLHSRFAARTMVIMDDGQRPDESEIASRWAKEFHARSSVYIDLEKGAWVLEFGGQAIS